MSEEGRLFRVADLLDRPARASSVDFAHLRWMLETIRQESSWPPDKQWRWLGYVAGASSRSEDADILDAVGSAAVLPDVHHETVLRNVNGDVLRGLPEADPQSAEVIAPWLTRLAHPLPAVQVAFGVGVVQAQLESLGLLDVDAERARTRPMFHRAYAQCGWTPPPTVAP